MTNYVTTLQVRTNRILIKCDILMSGISGSELDETDPLTPAVAECVIAGATGRPVQVSDRVSLVSTSLSTDR